MTLKEDVFEVLDKMMIEYEVIMHEAVYTILQMDNLDVDFKGASIVKNLFLKNSNGKKHYLLIMKKEKQANLKILSQEIESSTLSFASEKRLDRYLKLKKGAVSPLGIINDIDNHVELIIDNDLNDDELIGVHPNENTATLLMKLSSLIKLIENNGNTIRRINI